MEPYNLSKSGGFVSLRKRWISQNWRNQTHFLWMKFGRWIFFSRHAGVGSCKIADNRCWSLSSFFKHPESHFKFHSDFISFWLALFTLPHCRRLFVECSFNFYTLIGDGKPPPHRMNANPIKSCHCECEDKREKPNKSSKKKAAPRKLSSHQQQWSQCLCGGEGLSAKNRNVYLWIPAESAEKNTPRKLWQLMEKKQRNSSS